MPTIPIHPPSSTRASHEEARGPLPQLLQTPSGLALVEVQGTVSSTSSHVEQADADNSNTTGDGHSSGSTAALSLGKLVFPAHDAMSPETSSWDGKRVFLYVGRHQRMTGEVKKLPKPIAVVRRRWADETTGAEELEVAEIVYYKVLFAHRPEPVGGGEDGQ